MIFPHCKNCGSTKKLILDESLPEVLCYKCFKEENKKSKQERKVNKK